MSARAGPVVALVCALLLAGCTGDAGTGASPPRDSPVSTSPPAKGTPPFPSPTQSIGPQPLRFRASAAMADVRLLASQIGPRLTTGPAFRKAGRVVARRFADLGYDVRRQPFRVPAGDSWGVPVAAGRSFNVVATQPGVVGADAHRVVGAHLDTVAVAPGAEDNASGVAVLLELARLAAAADDSPLPTVFVAFGGEEPRGPGDTMHHFGSRHYVRTMSTAQRDSLVSMVSLDRVGVGASVPVCTGPLSPPDVQEELIALSRAMRIPAHRCALTTSDHWSFEKAGFTVARLGSTPYSGYHSEADLPRVVDGRQVQRVGRLTWAWLMARVTD